MFWHESIACPPILDSLEYCVCIEALCMYKSTFKLLATSHQKIISLETWIFPSPILTVTPPFSRSPLLVLPLRRWLCETSKGATQQRKGGRPPPKVRYNAGTQNPPSALHLPMYRCNFRDLFFVFFGVFSIFFGFFLVFLLRTVKVTQVARGDLSSGDRRP